MKKIISVAAMLVINMSAFACPMCEKQQPKILRGVVHGGVPQSKWDYLIVWVVAIITVITLFYAIKWLVRPGEKHSNHIKHTILNFE
jgi:small-conductance mechanosensitive channel